MFAMRLSRAAAAPAATAALVGYLRANGESRCDAQVAVEPVAPTVPPLPAVKVSRGSHKSRFVAANAAGSTALVEDAALAELRAAPTQSVLSWLTFGLLGGSKKRSRYEKPDTVEGFCNYDIAFDLFALTSIIYAYSEDPDFLLGPDESLAKFIDRIDDQGEVGHVLGLKTKQLVGCLERMVARSPDMLFVDFLDIADGDLQAAVTVSTKQKRIVVVFRGSESIMDWMQNLVVFKVAEGGDGARVHSGFADQLNPGYDRILDKVKEYATRHPGYKVYVTGHSLGGALSTLFGFRAAHDAPELDFEVVSFASPRVGNPRFKDLFTAKENLRHTRVANAGDTVTAIPNINYKHCGNNIRLHKDKAEFFMIDDPEGYYNPMWEYTIFNNLDVMSHFSDEYYERLAATSW